MGAGRFVVRSVSLFARKSAGKFNAIVGKHHYEWDAQRLWQSAPKSLRRFFSPVVSESPHKPVNGHKNIAWMTIKPA
jgi:hypothetical protein